MRSNVILFWLGVFLFAFLCPFNIGEGKPFGEKKEVVSATGSIKGHIVNSSTGEPVVFATIYFIDLERGGISHEQGDFFFRNIQEGAYRIRFQHVGYETLIKNLSVSRDDTTYVKVDLIPSVFRGSGIEVIGEYVQEDEITTYVERVVTGSQLRRQLGRTIAETLEDEAGIAQRSMGPAPARPVLRGLGGERLLILEDGGRTGDLSATASDHAVAIDPMTAEHIELIKGPSAMIHGSNTMGGVINIIRGQIPSDRPEHIHWSVGFQGETVNDGLSGGFRAYGPVSEQLPAGNRLAWRMDASARNSSDIRTPGGSLQNTGMTTLNASVGISYVDGWGMVGLSGNMMDMSYGVPGGTGIAEAHPNGVDLEMNRRYTEARFRKVYSDKWFRRIDVTWNYAYYVHRELEKPGDPSIPQPIGAEFGVLTNNLRFHLHHRELLFFNKGLFGAWFEHRDYASGGMTFTPETKEVSLAGYTFQENDWGKLNLQFALRFDVRYLSPEEKASIFLDADIEARTFLGGSGSVMATWAFSRAIQTGTVFTVTHRAPGIEELFSEGPHLANFAYEIGNPDLKREKGWGNEWFLRVGGRRVRASLALFRNQMNNYIFPRDTGERSIRRDDLNTFQYSENNVLMAGVELSYEVRLHPKLTTGGTASYVQGDFIDDRNNFVFLVVDKKDKSVPMMPPWNGRMYLEFNKHQAFRIGLASRWAAQQYRTDVFEEPTAGYVVMDAYLQYHTHFAGGYHTFTLTVENMADTEYRNHLSRIKSVMPEPGRNIKVLYRVYF